MSVQTQFSCTGIIALIFTGLLLGALLFASVRQSVSPQGTAVMPAQAVTASAP
jgi:hypothetical protein